MSNNEYREAQPDLEPLHCQDESRHQPHWWRADFGGLRYQCAGTKPKYEYQTATRYPDGRIERVGVSFAEDEYEDARWRAMGEYYDIKRDAEMLGSNGEVVLLRRPVAAWEVTDAE